ncbi:MAG: 16S rRNA (cytidine(1402)-2'-O)-methyltransferase, partial [Lachnospiraceae bacterium]|nr:16S rRNA (cytidine(1402)-2'-O)-methyltransferase [Lachnospiraceae bacterium]
RGECVIVMEGRSRKELEREDQKQWEEMSVSGHVALYESQGMDRKAAMKQAAKDRGMSKREVYAALLEKSDESL